MTCSSLLELETKKRSRARLKHGHLPVTSRLSKLQDNQTIFYLNLLAFLSFYERYSPLRFDSHLKCNILKKGLLLDPDVMKERQTQTHSGLFPEVTFFFGLSSKGKRGVTLSS